MRIINFNLLIAAMLFFICSCSSNKSLKSANYPEEQLGWKLGAQAYTFRLFTFAEALNKIDSCGLRYVEIFPGQVVGDGSVEKVGPNLSVEGRDKMKKLLRSKGITVYAFGVVGAKSPEEWERVFQFADDMGIQVINVEPSEEDLDVVSALCDKYKIHAALHNHPIPSRYWNPDVVIASLEGRSQYMGAAADVGHWMRSGLDPVESLKKLDGRILHLHFKDLNEFGNKKAHDVHWGTGKLPLDAVIVELKRQNFKGMLSAEYEYNWKTNKEDVNQSVINLRKKLQ